MPPEQATRAWRTGSEPFPLVVHSPPCRPGPRGPYVCLPNPPAVLSRGESAGSAVSLRGPGRSQLGLSRRGPGGERPREGPAVAPSEALGVTFFQAPEPRTQADAGTGPLQRPQVLAEQLAWLGPARVWRGLSGGAAASGGVRVRCCETDPPRWWCVVLMWQTATRAQAAGAGLAGGCEGLGLQPALPAARPSRPNARVGLAAPGMPRTRCSHPMGLAFVRLPKLGQAGTPRAPRL